jgi:hypothetical protein
VLLKPFRRYQEKDKRAGELPTILKDGRTRLEVAPEHLKRESARAAKKMTKAQGSRSAAIRARLDGSNPSLDVVSFSGDRPDVIRNPNLPSGQRTPERWFDTLAFSRFTASASRPVPNFGNRWSQHRY